MLFGSSSLVEFESEEAVIQPNLPMVPNMPNNTSNDNHEKVVLWLKSALEMVGGDSTQNGDEQLESAKVCSASTSTEFFS